MGRTLAVGLALGTQRDLLAREPAEAQRKLKLIVTGGHPGDPEYGCGGTISRYTDLGHEVVLLYYYEVSNGEDTVQFAPTHYVDITQTEARKRLACYAHASQAPDRFYALQESVTRIRGIEIGHQQAEAYIRHVQSPDFALPGT
jgi:LmbE family N-acetylglucosaminyl deacetylase